MKNKTVTKFNYEGVDTKGPGPLDQGVYKAKIADAELKESKQGNDMIVLSLEVFEDAAGEALAKKRKLTDRVVMSEKALFRVAILAEALGIDKPEDNDDATLKEWCETIKQAGADGVYFRLTHEAYQAIGDDGEPETRQAMRVGRYLRANQVGNATTIGDASNGASNGASETPTRRPRRGQQVAEA